ncbi:MAG TPA: hypothetical protein VK543_09530 [Puia sp.]|nr:hypothetical protein [Puia sp.]
MKRPSQRQKEIEIWKIAGAPTRHVVMLLSKDFLKLVLIIVLVAFPFSWWALNQWLNGFACKILF